MGVYAYIAQWIAMNVFGCRHSVLNRKTEYRTYVNR